MNTATHIFFVSSGGYVWRLVVAEMNTTRFVFCTSFSGMLKRSEPQRSTSFYFSGMLRRFVDRRDQHSQACSLLVFFVSFDDLLQRFSDR
ncbi:unnamed protein product [Cochlearia groenlandica]